MDNILYISMRDEYGFRPLNRSRGLELTAGERPEASYHLPEGRINLYSHSPTMRDIVHPFRPSGEVIAEVATPVEASDFRMYLSGSEQQFQELDGSIIEMLEELDSGDYYKQIL